MKVGWELSVDDSVIAQFLKFLENHLRQRLLYRLIESPLVAERIEEFHKDINCSRY